MYDIVFITDIMDELKDKELPVNYNVWNKKCWDILSVISIVPLLAEYFVPLRCHRKLFSCFFWHQFNRWTGICSTSLSMLCNIGGRLNSKTVYPWLYIILGLTGLLKNTKLLDKSLNFIQWHQFKFVQLFLVKLKRATFWNFNH